MTLTETNSHPTAAPPPETLLAGALSYIERGWPVLPLRPRAKTPLTSRGHLDASLDADQVRNWWERWPDANVGVATGPAGLLVIDVDLYKHDLDLEAWLAGRPWPDTLTVRTGRGGLQFLFTQPTPPLGCSAGALHRKIDTRGTGGYIVAPPSITAGTYTVVKEIPEGTAPLPQWLISELSKPAATDPPGASVLELPASGWVTPYGSRALEDEAHELARTATGRNAKLNSTAFRLGQLCAAGHLDRNTIDLRLTAAAQRASALGDHPLTDREIARTIESGVTAGLAHPATNRAPAPVRVATAPAPPAATPPRSSRRGKLICQPVEAYTNPPPDFLWGNRLTVGGLTIIAGDGGIGKSFLATNLAVSFANGDGLPEQGPDEHGSTVLVSFEDPGEVIRVRAQQMGYDPATSPGSIEVIYGPEAFRDDTGVARQLTPGDVHDLIDVLRSKPDLRLVVIDPLMSFIGPEVDPNRDQQVRAVLHRLIAVATELAVAVVVIAHTTKGSPDPSRALDSIAGSAGIKNIARSALIAMRDPANGRGYVFHKKSNWSAPASALEFSFTQGRFDWVGTAPESTLEQICRRSQVPPVERCASWLIETLRPGTVSATRVFTEGEAQGFAATTIRTAQRQLGVRVNKVGYQGQWYWSLPDDMH